jgi:hypothetical protein
VTEDGRIVGGEGWQEKVHNREERKKVLRMARNCRILHMPMEFHPLRVTIPDAVLIQFNLLMMSMLLLETCRGM